MKGGVYRMLTVDEEPNFNLRKKKKKKKQLKL